MKIIRLIGGLGNQMFQYAFGQIIKDDVAYWFDQVKGNPNVATRPYELDFFKCNPWILSQNELAMIIEGGQQLGGEFAYKIVEEIPPSVYNPELLKQENALFIGYFQCYQYYDQIRKQLLDEFVPSTSIDSENQKILDLIQKTNSVSLHIRRGDYVKLQHVHGLCNLEYYQKAIDFIVSKTSVSPHFFLFSDDIEWVKDNLKINFPFTVVDLNHEKKSPWDMWLMKHCKHNIIANSSFSWWGAWLNENPNKIVIAPKKWRTDDAPIDIVPPDWIRI